MGGRSPACISVTLQMRDARKGDDLSRQGSFKQKVQSPAHSPISSSVMLSATAGINAGLGLADAEAALFDAAAAVACF